MNEEQLLVKASVPAQVLEIPNSTFNLHYHNELVTHVKLRVFYQGMTRDKRLFTENFSNQLLQSLPQTPVVGYFDEESEDFVGHNHTQFIYGYVPENAKISFETDEDGTKWATTEIVLFTGRKDNIGKVAQKIIGKQHSLELDSNTMKYSIRRDETGQLKHIELQEGKFVGLSVLGDSQSPAFEGSGFFTEQDTTITETYTEVKNSVHQFLSNAQHGGEEMNEENKISDEILQELQKFMKITTDEMQKGVYEALQEKFGKETYIVQWSSTEDIVVFLDFTDGHYYRAKYAMAEDKITFEDKVSVKPRFLTEEEINGLFAETVEPVAVVEVQPEVVAIPDAAENVANAAEVVVKVKTENEELEKPQEIITGGKTLDDNEEDDDKEKGIFITESERVQIETDREELKAYRRERKLVILEQFSEFLTVEEKQVFNTKIDDFSVETLETELSKISMKKVLEQQQKSKNVGTGMFGIRTTPTPQSPDSGDKLASLVGRYKGK